MGLTKQQEANRDSQFEFLEEEKMMGKVAGSICYKTIVENVWKLEERQNLSLAALKEDT